MVNRKRIIITILSISAALLLTAGAIWYGMNYLGKKEISSAGVTGMDYEWQLMASEEGIVSDYIFQRTAGLMIEEAEVMIPSWYLVPGRLSYQPAEISEEYLLEDQALLLRMYIRTSDRTSAGRLVNRVWEYFDMEQQDNRAKSEWLSAFILYYENMGRVSDYDKIVGLAALLFEDDGTYRPETLSAARYYSPSFVSLEDNSAQEYHEGSVNAQPGADSEGEDLFEFDGVRLSSIDLALVRDLENAGIIAQGAYERNLNLVLGGIISDDISLYAFAYKTVDDEENPVSYIYSADKAASVDVIESVRTMRHLSEVQSLPDRAYSWVKNIIINSGYLRDTYYFVMGRTDGNEAVDCYVDLMEIAYRRDDTALFGRVCGLVGMRVATYTDSPALSMIYRERDGRYYVTAGENLGLCVLIY